MKRLVPCALSFGLLMSGCGGGKEPPPPPIAKQTAADEVLRIGNLWTNVKPEKGILSPPSKISLFRTHRKSELRVSAGAIIERLVIEEEIQLRDGPLIRCATQFEHQVGHRWGRKHGQAALEIVRPALNSERACDHVHPDGSLQEPARRALFVLRSDNLVAVEPIVDKRIYTAGQL
jgi:hypothetical protein